METLTPPSTPPTAQSSPEAWFESLQPPAPEHPKNRPKKLLFFSILFVTLCVVVGGIWLIIGSRYAPCLTAEDYRALTGATYSGDSFSPKESFYSYSVSFNAGAASYATDEAGKSEKETVQAIARFYAEHTDKSIAISLDSDTVATNPSLASERIATIARDLISAGIPEAAIVKKAPTTLAAEEEAEEATTAIISITSAATCK